MTKPNYTPEMVNMLREAQPIDFEKAQDLAKKLNKNVRSVIAKVKREGLDYISKPAPAKKKAAPTKGDLVHAICKAVNIDSCDGLEKATGLALSKLLEAIS